MVASLTTGRAVPGKAAALSFARALESVFFATPFIAAAEFRPATDKVRTLRPEQWQAAVGRRLLTTGEEAARIEYFQRKIAALSAAFHARLSA